MQTNQSFKVQMPRGVHWRECPSPLHSLTTKKIIFNSIFKLSTNFLKHKLILINRCLKIQYENNIKSSLNLKKSSTDHET